MSQTGLPSPANNPANLPDRQTPQRNRVPMSLPTQKLAAPEIPGFHTHWMRGEPQRIAQALRAGYEWVHPDEVDLNDFGIANGPEDSGNQDLGSRVSYISGRDESGGAQRLYLMKLPLEYWEEDQKALGANQEKIAAQLRGDKGFFERGQEGYEAETRYSHGEQKRTMFHPKPQRRA
jgi:hypothetical protein